MDGGRIRSSQEIGEPFAFAASLGVVPVLVDVDAEFVLKELRKGSISEIQDVTRTLLRFGHLVQDAEVRCFEALVGGRHTR